MGITRKGRSQVRAWTDPGGQKYPKGQSRASKEEGQNEPGGQLPETFTGSGIRLKASTCPPSVQNRQISSTPELKIPLALDSHVAELCAAYPGKVLAPLVVKREFAGQYSPALQG